MTQNLNFLNQKLTFRTAKFQTIIIDQLNNLLSILDAFRLSISKHHYVINIHKTLQIQHIFQDIVHHTLENARCVFMPKWHLHKLEGTSAGHERQVTLGVQINRYLPKTFRHVQLREKLSSAETLNYLINIW